MLTLTCDEFLASAKRTSSVPRHQIRFEDDDILAFADEEMDSVILPFLTSLKQDYLVISIVVPLVANTQAYKLPYRAIGRTLRSLHFCDPDGSNESSPLVEVTLEDRSNYRSGRGYSVEGDKILLVSSPGASPTRALKMRYELTPSRHVLLEKAGRITAIDTATGIVTINATITEFTAGAEMDFIDGKPGNTILSLDVANSNVADDLITFDPDNLPSDLKVGDYLALAGQTPVVQLPSVLAQCLVIATAIRLMESQCDEKAWNLMSKRLEKALMAAAKVLTPRVSSGRPVVMSNSGLLRHRGRNWLYSE